MKLIHFLLLILLFLLGIIIWSAMAPEVKGATGVYHPDIKGMFISPNNIDQTPTTRWLGYCWGAGIILLFAIFLFIGNRKKGKITIIGKWIALGMGLYFIVFTMMVVANWQYNQYSEDVFFTFLPIPTAWMIYGVWSAPLILTFAFVFLFETAIISPEEEADFMEFIEKNKH